MASGRGVTKFYWYKSTKQRLEMRILKVRTRTSLPTPHSREKETAQGWIWMNHCLEANRFQ